MVQEELKSSISSSIRNNANIPALIPFIVSGFPDLDTTKELLFLFEKYNVAAIELGIPFSDPLADGPVIQAASKQALDNGINLPKIFNMLDEIKGSFKTPLILFSYFNPINIYGIEEFIKKAKSVNVAGIICPDLPIEESEEFQTICKENGIDFILLVAPTSNKERIKLISQKSGGFIYLVSSTGVTGVREGFSTVLSSILTDIKSVTDTPVAVGFGVSKPEHIQSLKELGVDAAIVGSAIVKLIDQYKNDKAVLLDKMSEYLNSLYKAY